MPGNHFNLPNLVGQAGKILAVNETETDYIWITPGSGGTGYVTIENDGIPAVQRTILNFSSLFTVSDDVGNLSTDVDIDVEELANDNTFVTDLVANMDFTDALATDSNFITELADNTAFVEDIANNSNFVSTLVANSTFLTDLTSNSTFITDLIANNTFTTDLAASSNFITHLSSNTTFVEDVANNANFISTLSSNSTFVTDVANNSTFISTLSSNSTFITNVTDIVTGGGSGGIIDAVTATITQASHGFSVGNIVRSSGSAGAYAKAQADTDAHAEVVGIVTAVISSSVFIVTTHGYFTSGVPAQAAGTIMFLSNTTAGGLILTPPSTSGTVNKALVTIITNGSIGFFNNYRGYLNP